MRVKPRWTLGIVLLAVLALTACTKAGPGQVSCCSSWSVVGGDDRLVVRARVQEPGAPQEHTGPLGEKYRVVPFTLVATEVIKPSVRQEQSGDRLQLWAEAPDRVKGLVGREAVFLLVTSDGRGSFPAGYTLYAADSVWAITGDRVSGGTGAIALRDAPYTELVQRVKAALPATAP